MSKKAPKAAVPPTEVLPHLWIGSNRNVKDRDLMANHGITYILNVAHELDSEPGELEGSKIPTEFRKFQLRG
jgi:hypothetical protein